MPFQRSTNAQFSARSCRFAVWFVASVLSLTSVRAQDPAQALEDTLTRVIEQTEPSVVSIARVRLMPATRVDFHPQVPRLPGQEAPVPPTNPEDPDFQPNGYGTGIIIGTSKSSERFVLTNYHVVQGGPVWNPALWGPTSPRIPGTLHDGVDLFVRFTDRRSCNGAIIAADPRSDLAVLRLDASRAGIDENDLKPLDWSISAPVRKGQLVIMLGNPYALAHDGSTSASWGMISNVARRPLPWTADQSSKYMMYRLGNLIQIDGRLNLGTSGGPLLNLKGELVGLTTSLAAIEGYDKSSGFAIPIDSLTHRIIEELVAGQEVGYGMLGIGPGDVTPADFRKLNTGLKQAAAARVDAVQKDAPADRAGIMKDDVILSVNDIPVYSKDDLMRVVGLHAPETKVKILLWRHGLPRPFTTEVTLCKWPAWEDERIIETSPKYPAWRGITVDYSTGRHKYNTSAQESFRRAVVVTRVASDSVAHNIGLQPGVFITEVNRTPVQTPGEFHEATRSLRGPVELRLYDEFRHYEGRRIVIGE